MRSRAWILVGAALLGCSSAAIYQGHLVIDPEVETFMPCGTSAALLLDYDSKTRAPIAKRQFRLRKAPYEKTFAVLKGEIGPKLDCGLCVSYEGSFKVVEVIEHREESPKDCET